MTIPLLRRLKSTVSATRSALYAAYVANRYPLLSRSVGIPSHLTLKERVALYHLSRNARCVAEIGSYLGASACCFGAALRGRGDARIVCIDTWNNDAMSEGARDTFQEFSRNTAEFGKMIMAVRGKSHEVVDRVRAISRRIDVLFIDGDHSHEGVKADWNAYREFLGGGSVVIFHDSGWADGVKRVIAEDVMPVVGRFDFLPNMWWGIVKTPAPGPAISPGAPGAPGA